MKYIRTNDGKIHEVLDANSRLIFVKRNMSELDEPCYGDPSYAKHKIVKQADTIEELIDAYFIVSKKDDSKWGTVKEKDVAEIYNESSYSYYVYGAIKIKENNQYIFKTVTKPMNEKGELELL